MRVLWLTGAIVLVDQVTKLWVKGISIPSLGIHRQGMPYGFSVPILGDFFRLTYIENPGMAFGIDVGGKLFFSLFSIALTIGILFFLYKGREERTGFRISLALILGGAIGNLIDRTFYGLMFNEAPLFHGKVVDFFDVDFFNIDVFGFTMSRWPVFNIADAAVTVGIVLLLFTQHRRKEMRESAVAAEPGGPVVPLPHSSPDQPSR